jgi:hypothetical protein
VAEWSIAPVLKTDDSVPQSPTTTALLRVPEDVLPIGLPFSIANDSDLRSVVEAWPNLPDVLKRAILALINAADAERGMAGRGRR